MPRLLQETTASLLRGGGAEQLLRYPELGGGAADRAAGARWLARRGLEVDADHVVLADGADHAILLTLMALGRAQGRVLVEALSYPGVRTMAATLGLPVQSVSSDADGMRPDALEREAHRGPALVVLTPTLHNPTTHTMTRQRRDALARVVASHDLLLLEDDVYLYHPAEAPSPFALLVPDRTAYVTSFSKSFAAGLRIGYLGLVDRSLAERLGPAARATTSTPAGLAAAVASCWIDGGRSRGRARGGPAGNRGARCVVSPIVARWRAWARHHLPAPLAGTPARVESPQFVERATQHGVAVRASDPFAVDIEPPEAVRFSISAPYAISRPSNVPCSPWPRTLREPHGFRRAVASSQSPDPERHHARYPIPPDASDARCTSRRGLRW